ncbi:MAG: hypothetical protein O7A06_07785 [Acidobacteria bacterium]|nr:hypothetical protein [Acidobacteriota bacterium]
MLKSKIIFVVFVLGILLVSSCGRPSSNPEDMGSPAEPPGITLSIHNGQPRAPLELVAGQEYVFDRIVLEAENRNIASSEEALEWLRDESRFQVLDWTGVREARAYWRNYKAVRPAADVFAHVFEGAAWMNEANALELSVLDAEGVRLGEPLLLSNQDFLNRQKQWDFDMIRAEFRYEDFAQHKDRSSAKVKRAVAKIVFAIQTNLSKRLVIPQQAKTLRIVWDKNPQQAILVPIRLISSSFAYGMEIQTQLQPEKDLYMPGDVIRATFTVRDDQGGVLKLSEFAANSITRLYVHLDGPRHDPTFYHEEWLNDFKGNRYAYHLRSPALGLGQRGQSLSTQREAAPLDPSGTSMVVELHVPENLPEEAYGTYEIRVSGGREYGSQVLQNTFAIPIQVGKRERTSFERFGCIACHVPETDMDIGLLIPPMAGREALTVDNFQECVMCHDNSRNGSRRLDKYLHIIHMNRDNFPVAKNNCVMCHITAASIRKLNREVCSHCHESIHPENRATFTDDQCQGCHTDYGRGHIVPPEIAQN